jgi:hypothetical protein
MRIALHCVRDRFDSQMVHIASSSHSYLSSPVLESSILSLSPTSPHHLVCAALRVDGTGTSAFVVRGVPLHVGGLRWGDGGGDTEVQ